MDLGGIFLLSLNSRHLEPAIPQVFLKRHVGFGCPQPNEPAFPSFQDSLNVGASMVLETSQKLCPKCSSIISEGAPGGLCPHCLMQFVAMSTGGADLPLADRSPPDLETIRAAFPLLEILELIGQGGMGAVYKARQPQLERIVALKILPIRLACEPLFAERFEREGRLLARLNHPNIVGVYDFGQAGGLYYLIMEYVDGVNLRQAFASARFTPQQALSVIPKICEALQFAHDEGVLHRDIKPENILLDTKGRVKIADFGIAKFAGVDDKTGLTATGATIGTPHYMAPEQVERPADVDHRADIFSLGVVFYEMLTGELPLGRFSAPSERSKSLDARIDKVVMRALEKDRERRQQSANEVRTQVEFLSGQASEKRISIQASATMPPILDNSQPRFDYRSTVAIALVIASILLPIAIAISLDVGMERIPAYLATIAAWFGIPGTLLGIFHLQYLGRSGQRNGLITAVLASTFWPFTLAACLFFFLASKLLFRVHSSASEFVESLEVTLVLVLCIATPVLGVWSIKKWIERTRPDPRFANKTPHPVELVLHFMLKAFAVTLWTFFGLVIVYLSLGLTRKPVTVLYDVTVPQPAIPEWHYLNLDIATISTKENVLVIDVIDGVSFMGMGGIVAERGESDESTESASQWKFLVAFEGPPLLPDAEVLASESFSGKCFFPGERSEVVSYDLTRGQTATLAFAFPDPKTAQACKLRIERQLHAGIWGAQNSNKKPLFQVASVFGEYRAFAESSR